MHGVLLPVGQCHGQGSPLLTGRLIFLNATMACYSAEMNMGTFIAQCHEEVRDVANKRVLSIFTLNPLQARHWVRVGPHTLVYLESGCIDFIMMSLGVTILTEFDLGFLSGNYTFAHSFNKIVSHRVISPCSWWKARFPQGANQIDIDLCWFHSCLHLETNGMCGGSGHTSFPIQPGGHIGFWWFGQIHAGHDVWDCQCRNMFWDSNAWTALTDIPSKEFHWSLRTNWRLDWCQS